MKTAKRGATKLKVNAKDFKVPRFSVEFEVANNRDSIADLGHIAPHEVRRIRLQGLVDSGATRLMLPASAVKQLGLPKAGSAKTK